VFIVGALIFFVLASVWLLTGSHITQTVSVNVSDGAIPVRNAHLELSTARHGDTTCFAGLDGYGHIEATAASDNGNYSWSIHSYREHEGRRVSNSWMRPDIALCIEAREQEWVPIWYSKRLPHKDMVIHVECELSTAGPQKCVMR
jgi:hypothetical protein